MADHPAALIAARAQLLLRCQAARLNRQRAAAARAAQAQAMAAGALADATAACHQFEAERQAAMRRSYDALTARTVSPAMLQALPVLQARQLAAVAALAAAADAAASRLRSAAGQAEHAAAGLAEAARKSRRRERLAERTLAAHRGIMAAAEEAEREDTTLDTWRPGR